MKLNYSFMCFVFIVVLIPHSVDAFPLPVGQKIPEFYKSSFGICERNIKSVSMGFNKISSFYNTRMVNKGNTEIGGGFVNVSDSIYIASPPVTEISTKNTNSPDECRPDNILCITHGTYLFIISFIVSAVICTIITVIIINYTQQ